MRRAFTLIELLVTIAVIAVLIGIMVPALNKARGSARRTLCASQLRQVGVGLRQYLNDHNDRFPYASYMPSIGPYPLAGDRPIFIADVLKPDVGDAKAFQCPNDSADDARLAPNAGRSYFDSEKSSYQYRDERFVFLGGQTLAQVAARIEQFTGQPVADNTIRILWDYKAFHGPAGSPGAKRYLYVDGHVADFEN